MCRSPPGTRAKPIRCTYFLVTGLRVHLGCRSGEAAEGWSGRSRRGSAGGSGCSSLNKSCQGQWRAFRGQFPPFTLNFPGSLPLPVCAFFSVHVRSVEGSLRPPETQKAASLWVSPSLCRLVVAVCSGLGSLSLPFPPPPLPACDPTLRPHPSSGCQSGAAQPCRGAQRSGRRPSGGCWGDRPRTHDGDPTVGDPPADAARIFYCFRSREEPMSP